MAIAQSAADHPRQRIGEMARASTSDSFDLVRLIAATAVLWSHQHALTGLPEPVVPFLKGSFGAMAVWVFFAVSGHLNAKSLLNRGSSLRFLLARALRIYPALIVSLVVTAIYCAFATTEPGAEFNKGVIRFLTSNTFMFIRPVQIRLPGIFDGLPYPKLINGSLWTIPCELNLYVILAICMFGKSRVVLAVGAVLFIGLDLSGFNGAVISKYDIVLVQLGTIFFTGAAIAAFPMLTAVLIIIGVGAVTLGIAGTGERMLLAVAAVGVGHIRIPSLLQLKHDVSYGVYLYAFPCQQISASITTAFIPSIMISATLTFALAYLSCRLVEEPALKLKRHIYATR